MARSRRKLKKTAPKVRVGVVKRSKKFKAPVPANLKSPRISTKLGQAIEWATQQTAGANYAQSGVAMDPNAVLEAQHSGKGRGIADDDLRSALGQPLQDTPKKVSPLTTRQRQIIRALVDRHGSDIEGMSRDVKLNRMLLPPAKLRRMVDALHVHADGARVRFQQPKKGLL